MVITVIDVMHKLKFIRLGRPMALGQSTTVGAVLHRLMACGLVPLLVLGAQVSYGRDFRVARLPNGAVFGCANCHVNPQGGGTRTPFGNAVNAAVGGSAANVAFWNATLAAQDSDGDGISNGTELGDSDGNGVPTPGATVTNPGNRPPVFSSVAVTQAVMGLAYSYTATATDHENNPRTFSKVSGPSWLNVSSGGAVTGTPPDGSAGVVPVAVSVRDASTASSGYSGGSSTQLYQLTIISSFAGWQRLNFTLPGETNLAAALADPNSNGVPNLVEYAYRRNPKATGSTPLPVTLPQFDGGGRMVVSTSIRDDDPRLEATLEVSSTALFTVTNVIQGVTSDPVPHDGFKTLTFTDSLVSSNEPARFGRIKLRLLP